MKNALRSKSSRGALFAAHFLQISHIYNRHTGAPEGSPPGGKPASGKQITFCDALSWTPAFAGVTGYFLTPLFAGMTGNIRYDAVLPPACTEFTAPAL